MRSATIRLPEEQRKTLTAWATGSHERLSERARVVLLSAQGHTAVSVAESLGLTVRTVYKWRQRFLAHGSQGLRDRARPGQPRRLSRARREEIVRLTVDDLPPEGQRWTIRSVARRLGVTQHQVRQIWSEQGLRPHTGRGAIVDERLVQGSLVALLGLFLSPGCNVVALGSDRSTGASVRIHRRVPAASDSALRVLLRQGAALVEPDGGRAREGLAAFLEQVAGSSPATSPILLVFSSSKAQQHESVSSLVARRPETVLSAKSCLSVWADSLQLWMEQNAHASGQLQRLSELTRAMEAHAREPRTTHAPFCWIHRQRAVGDSKPVEVAPPNQHFAQVSR